MRSKALAVQSLLEITENRAKWCQISGHSPTLRARCRGLCVGVTGQSCGGVQATYQVKSKPMRLNDHRGSCPDLPHIGHCRFGLHKTGVSR
jgi:hypothetical protein